jgi:hypothetical protein
VEQRLCLAALCAQVHVGYPAGSIFVSHPLVFVRDSGTDKTKSRTSSKFDLFVTERHFQKLCARRRNLLGRTLAKMVGGNLG